jgi:hypothetical protein
MQRTIGEHILFLLSRSPEDNDISIGKSEWSFGNVLSLFQHEIPNFSELVKG